METEDIEIPWLRWAILKQGIILGHNRKISAGATKTARHLY